jgi:hypothetical protein
MGTEPAHDTRVADLEGKVAALESLVLQLTAVPDGPPPAALEAGNEPTSRRSMLRGAALVAGAAVAGAVASTARPAAAADGDFVRIGYATTTTAAAPVAQPKLTQLNSDHAGSAAAFLLQASPGAPVWANTDPLFPGALWAATSTPSKPTGLYAWSGVDDGIGVVGRAIGARSVGVIAHGNRANLALDAGVDPRTSGLAHAAGDVAMDGVGQLWVCVVAGTPGVFRKLAGPSTAGSFHPIATVRVADTRLALPAQGAITAPGNKVLSVADGRDLNTGAVTAANAVPDGAAAVSGNITVTGTTAAGFATVMPGDAATFGGSTVNWSSPGSTVANAFVSKLDATRHLKIFVDAPGASAQVIIDINGYYL